MRKIIEDYLRKRKRIAEMISAGNAPEEKVLDEFLELEAYLRKCGYDPDGVFIDSASKGKASNQNNQGEFPKVISEEIRVIKPVVPRNEGFFKSAEKIEETEHGLRRLVGEAWFIVACGKRVAEKDIAGQCQICQRYECSEHFVNCSEDLCGIGLCIKCRVFLEIEPGNKIPFCPDHYNSRALDLDTWEYMRKAGNLLALKERWEK